MAILGSLQVRLGIDATSLTKEMSQVTKKFQAPLKKMQRGLRGLTSFGSVAGGAGLGLGLQNIVRSAANFEEQMNGVQAILQPTTAEFAKLREEAKNLGTSTQFSASEAAKGIEILGKNGLKTADILGGALNASLLLSASTGADLGASADVATDAMKVFGKQASDLKDVVNNINGVIVNSKFGFDDYKNALASGGASAVIAGQSLDDFNAVIAATSNFFATGETAGTAYKVFIDRLVNDSKAAKKATEALGLSLFDTQGNLKGFGEIADQLRDGLSGLTDQGRIKALTDLFGTRGKNFATALSEAGSESIKLNRDLIANANAQKQAETRLKGLNGQLKLLRSAFEGLSISISDAGILQAVTSFIKKITGLVQKLSESNPQLLKMGFIAAGVTAFIGPLAFAASSVLGAFGALVPIFARVGLALKTIAPRFKLLTAFIARAGAMGGFRLALAALGRTIAVVAGGPIGIAITAFSLFHKKIFQGIGKIRAWILEFMKTQQVKNAIAGLKAAIVGLSGIIDRVKASFSSFVSEVKAKVQAFLNFWRTDTSNTANKIGQIVGALIAKKVKFFQSLIPKIQEVWEQIKAGAKAAVDSIVEFFRSLPAKIASINWASIGNDIINGITNGINNGKSRALEAIKSVGRGMISGFKREIQSNSPSKVFHQEGLNITDGISNGIGQGTMSAVQAMQEAGRQLIQESAITVEDIKQQFETISHIITDGIFSALEGGAQGFKQWADDVIKQIARVIVQQQILKAISGAAAGGGAGSGILKGIGNFIAGARADGGPVSGGKNYLVGERGPEIFSPGRNGNIIPNHEMGGGGQSNVFNISPGVTRPELRMVLEEMERTRILDNVRNFAEGGQSAAAMQY